MAILKLNGIEIEYSAVELVDAYCPVLDEDYKKVVFFNRGTIAWDAPRHLDIDFFADHMNRLRKGFVKQSEDGLDMKHLRRYRVKLQEGESAISYINKVDVKMYQRYLHYHVNQIVHEVAALTGQTTAEVKLHFSKRINRLVSEYRAMVRRKPKMLDIRMKDYYNH